MTLEQFYEIMGLDVINNPLFKELTKNRANDGFARKMATVEARAKELYNFIIADPDGYMTEGFDWNHYYGDVSELVGYVTEIKVPAGVDVDEEKLTAFKQAVGRMDEGIPGHGTRDRHAVRSAKLEEIAKNLPKPTKEQLEERKAALEAARIEKEKLLAAEKEIERQEREEMIAAEVEAELAKLRAKEHVEEPAEQKKAEHNDRDELFIEDTNVYKNTRNDILKMIDANMQKLSGGMNTLVADYNKAKNPMYLAKLMNLYTLLDRLDVMKEESLRTDPEVFEQLEEINHLKNNKESLADIQETVRIFEALANDPVEDAEIINEDILSEAYSHYYKPEDPELEEEPEKEPEKKPEKEQEKKQEKEPAKEPKIEPKNEAKGEEKIDTNTVLEFETYLRNLKMARTKRNSETYENIIKALEFVNSHEKVPKGKDLDAMQTYAVKLLVIKNSINEYIAHKAKDGVNKNIGKKLGAVESLNVEVSNRLSKLVGLASFKINGKDVDLGKYPITLEQERQLAKNANPNVELPGRNPSGKKDLHDDCMRRIITKAIEKKCSDSQIKNLKRMRIELSEKEIPQPELGLIHQMPQM